MDIINISDVEDYPPELVNPEFEQVFNFYIKKNFFIMTFSKNISNIIFGLYQELPEIEPLGEELSDDKDEEVPEIASFTSRFHIKNIIHSNVPVEYPSTSPELKVLPLYFILQIGQIQVMHGKM